MITFRRWLSRQLYLWSCRIVDNWHEVELVDPEGQRVTFRSAGDFSATWPEGWNFSCSCGDHESPTPPMTDVVPGQSVTWPDPRLDGDDVDPEGIRDATHVRRIRSARRVADNAVDELRAAVEVAREAGDPWAIIGIGLGTTGPEAQRLFGGG